jgi:betaine-aldehyde dehydrogenase
LIAGNTVVLKPSEQTTLSALRLGEICAEVLPAGVVNIVSGGGQVGEAIVRHEDVPRIALIGSVASGRRVQAAAAETAVKSVTLELGGKNPIIVFDDADIDRALDGAIGGMNFLWQGQSCGSTSRLYVQRPIFDEFISRLGARLEAMTIGDPFDPTSDVGAIVSERQFRSVSAFVASAIADERATLVTGGVVERGDSGGWFVRPTLFTVEDPAQVKIGHEEIFGPVLTAAPFEDYDEVIAKANALRFGLTASVWTTNLSTAMRAVHELEAGYVWVNASAAHIPGTSFGGVKDSGLGREEGLDELLSYTTSKNVYLRF